MWVFVAAPLLAFLAAMLTMICMVEIVFIIVTERRIEQIHKEIASYERLDWDRLDEAGKRFNKASHPGDTTVQSEGEADS